MSDQPRPDSIPAAVAAARATLSHLLRLVRPAQAEPIDRLVGELADHLDRLLELIAERATHQSAAGVVAVLERLERLERRVEAGERERAVGD